MDGTITIKRDMVTSVTIGIAIVLENLEHHTPSMKTFILYIADNDNPSPKNSYEVTSFFHLLDMFSIFLLVITYL